MSGVLSALTDLLGNKATVTLDGFTFADFEVPEQINHGGQQQVTTHKFPGGGRTLDMMGEDDRPIAWGGTFLGASAVSRAGELDDMRRAGVALDLTWGENLRRVVISNLDLREGFNRVDYSIELIKAPLETNQDESTSPQASITDDIADAQGFDLSGIAGDVSDIAGQVTTGLRDAQALVTKYAALVPGNLAISLTSKLAQTSTLTGAAASLAEGNLVGAASNITGKFGAVLSASGSLAQATAASASIGRALSTLQSTTT